jgi:hypothetical protein
MKVVLLVGILFCSLFAFAGGQECDPFVSSESSGEIAAMACEQMKQSKQCQDLYKTLSKEDAADKALTCSADDSALAYAKEGAQYYAGCYVGGWAMIIDPIYDKYKSTKNWVQNYDKNKDSDKAKAKIEQAEREAAKAERELCDKDPNAKLHLVKSYNASAPELLKIKEPSTETLNRATCASVLATLKGFREQKMDELGNGLMRKEMIGETLTPDEKAFVEYRNSTLKVDGIDVVAIAKQQLNEMGIQLDCYNAYYKARITCEAISQVATLAMGPAGWALKAAKAAKIAKLAGVAVKAEKGVVAERAVAGASASTNAAKSASTIPKLTELKDAERASELARRASLTKEQRIAEVESRIGRKLSTAEGDALEKAHNVALGTGRGSDGTYATTDHIKKMSTLKRGDESLSKSKELAQSEVPNFTAAERKFLMEEGYAGNLSNITEARAAADRVRLSAEKLRAEGKIEASRKSYEESAKSYDVLLKDKLYPMSDRDYLVGASINAHAGTPERLKTAGELYIKGKSEYRYIEGGVPKRLSKEQVIFEDLQRERDELRSLVVKFRGTPQAASAQENYDTHRRLIESVTNQLTNMPQNFKAELLKP